MFIFISIIYSLRAVLGTCFASLDRNKSDVRGDKILTDRHFLIPHLL